MPGCCHALYKQSPHSRTLRKKGMVVATPSVACSTRVYRVIMSTCGVCTASGSKNSLGKGRGLFNLLCLQDGQRYNHRWSRHSRSHGDLSGSNYSQLGLQAYG